MKKIILITLCVFIAFSCKQRKMTQTNISAPLSLEELLYKTTFRSLEDALQSNDTIYELDLNYRNSESECQSINFTNFPYLQSVAYECPVSQEIPENITTLINLERLNWKSNAGKLPDLSKLNYLNEIDLSNNSFTSIDCSKLNKGLKSLILDGNHQLSKLINLQSLESIETLSLSKCQGLNLKDVKLSLKEMENVNLSNMGLSALPVFVKNLQSLNALDLSGNKQINLTGSTLEIEYLTMNGCDLNSIPNEVLEYKGLLGLSLLNNNISVIPEDIYKLKSLKQLEILGNNISEKDINRLQKLLPNTKIYSDFNEEEFGD